MILYFAAVAAIGFIAGQIWERYKWVRTTKNGKVVEVDGEIYTARRVERL